MQRPNALCWIHVAYLVDFWVCTDAGEVCPQLLSLIPSLSQGQLHQRPLQHLPNQPIFWTVPPPWPTKTCGRRPVFGRSRKRIFNVCLYGQYDWDWLPMHVKDMGVLNIGLHSAAPNKIPCKNESGHIDSILVRQVICFLRKWNNWQDPDFLAWSDLPRICLMFCAIVKSGGLGHRRP